MKKKYIAKEGCVLLDLDLFSWGSMKIVRADIDLNLINVLPDDALYFEGLYKELKESGEYTAETIKARMFEEIQTRGHSTDNLVEPIIY